MPDSLELQSYLIKVLLLRGKSQRWKCTLIISATWRLMQENIKFLAIQAKSKNKQKKKGEEKKERKKRKKKKNRQDRKEGSSNKPE